MIVVSKDPARLLRTIFATLFVLLPLLALPAQTAGGTKPSGTMSGPSGAAAQQQPALEGMIAAIEGSTLVLTGASGAATRVVIQDDTLILGRQLTTLASIRPGEAMGVAAIRGDDGSLTATAINVFPDELWKRVRKGQFPMASGQVMTNAQVDRVVDKVEGRTLYLKYEMLTAAIAVPASAEIRRSLSLKLKDLKVGEKVSVRLAGGAGNQAAAMVSLDLPAG